MTPNFMETMPMNLNVWQAFVCACEGHRAAMSAPRAAAQLLRIRMSLGYSFRPLLRGRGRCSAPSPHRAKHIQPFQPAGLPDVLAAAAIFVMDNGQLDQLAFALSHVRPNVFVGRTHIPPVVSVADQALDPIVDCTFMP